MAAHLLLLTTLLFSASSNAQSTATPDDSLPAALTTLPAYSKAMTDYSAISSAAAPVATAFSAWISTQSALPTSLIQSQDEDFANAAATASTPPLPAYVTALPSSIQAGVSSAYQALAGYEQTDLAPLYSDHSSAMSSAVGVKPGAQTTFATSAVPTNSANGTSKGSPTSPAGGPSPTQPVNGAGRVLAGGLFAVGLTGVMALL